MRALPLTVAEIATRYCVTEEQVLSLQAAMRRTWDIIRADWLENRDQEEMLELYPSEGSMVTNATVCAPGGHVYDYGQQDLEWLRSYPFPYALCLAVWSAKRCET